VGEHEEQGLPLPRRPLLWEDQGRQLHERGCGQGRRRSSRPWQRLLLVAVDTLDIDRAADLLLQQPGMAAKSHAMDRALDMRAAGDDLGEAVWLQVFDAMMELQSTAPTKGQPLH
jgi:hypothetical protein